MITWPADIRIWNSRVGEVIMVGPTKQAMLARIKTQHLLLVASLAEYRSVQRAAQALNMTQPAASKLLHQLETILGVSLFIRHPRGVAPTEFGEILIRHARVALAELRHAHDSLEALRTGLAGHIRIGTEATSATGLVPRAVALLKRRFPRVTVGIDLAFSEALVERLKAGTLDIAVARLGSIQDEAELNHEMLAATSHAVVARAGHPLLLDGPPTWPELQQQCWVLPPPGNVMRSGVALLFRRHRLGLPTQVVETAALPIIIALLQASDMVAPLPTVTVLPYCERGQLAALPLLLDLRLGNAHILTRREPLMPAASAMLDALREIASEGVR
jgi:DNA-binding transcriptional LysR family regulator